MIKIDISIRINKHHIKTENQTSNALRWEIK